MRHNVAVVCRPADIYRFRAAGFTVSAEATRGSGKRLSHRDPNQAFNILVEFGAAGIPFAAEVARTVWNGWRANGL